MFVDSHCHLNFPEFKGQLDVIREAMAQAKVDRALCICTTMEEFDAVHALALRYDNFWATVGVHPDNEGVTEPSVQDLLDRTALPRVVGIGETGLDYFRLGERSVADMQWQRARFCVHIEAAQRSGKPLVIHTRNSAEDTLGILREARRQTAVRGVFHCFTENDVVARAALDEGFYISFSGIVTFKNAQALRDVARFVPMDRILIETDSPYLAPAPHRGKTNNPSYVPFVAQTLAEVKGVPVEEIAHATTCNFEILFEI